MEDVAEIFVYPSIEVDSGEEYFEDDFETVEGVNYNNCLTTIIDRNQHQSRHVSPIPRSLNHIVDLEEDEEEEEERRFRNRISQHRRIPQDLDLNVFPSVFAHDMFLSDPSYDYTIETDGVGSLANFMDDDVLLGLGLDFEDRRAQRRDNCLGTTDLMNFRVIDGVVEDIGSDYLDGDLDDGLDFQLPPDLDHDNGSFDYDYGMDDLMVGGLDWRGDDFHVSERTEVTESIIGCDDDGIEIVRYESDSDFNDTRHDMIMGASSGSVGVLTSNWNAGDFVLPRSFQSLQVEEEVPVDLVEDFEWEEIGQIGLNVSDPPVRRAMDLNEDNLFHSTGIAAAQRMVVVSEDENEEDDEEEEEIVRDLEWDVLFILNNINPGSLPPLEYDDQDDFMDPLESGEFFEQLGVQAAPIYGSPPASRLVVEKLPSIIVTEEDVTNNDAVCAICKDDISIGVSVKQLPCKHHFHDGCILPWLDIRNTCPVCRYELATDNPEYEDHRARRATTPTTERGGGGHHSRIPFELFPEN